MSVCCADRPILSRHDHDSTGFEHAAVSARDHLSLSCNFVPSPLAKGNMANRGGARHFAKSLVEVGALQKVLTDFESIVCDMRGYETLSRSSGYDWKGLIHCLPLVEGLLCLCKKAEVHTQPLKRGLTGLLEGKPSLNKTRFVGSVWVQLRQERIVVLLNHIRRLARDPKRGNAIQRLSGLEYGRLQEVLAQVSLEEADGEETLLKKGPSTSTPLQKGAPSTAAASVKDEPLPKGSKRKLERVVSEDSEGFPKMLVSPTKGGEGGPRSLLRPGHRARARALQKADSGGGESIDPPSTVDEENPIRRRLGYGGSKGKAKKRPAAAAPKSRAAASAASASAAPLRKGKEPWKKLYRVNATKPRRIYILGLKDGEDKARLVVEISQARSSSFKAIASKLWKALHEQHLSKEEATKLRETLVKEHEK